MARGAAKVVSVNGALTVTFATASGQTPTVYSDEALTTTITLPATVADGAATTFYFPSPGAYTASVKTAAGTQIAGDLNSTRVITLFTGDVAVLNYDTRLVSRDASGDSGRHSPNSDLSGTYLSLSAAAVGYAPRFNPNVAPPEDFYWPWFGAVNTTVGVSSVTGGLGIRWTPKRDTTLYGVTVNITASAGNICVSLYDEGFVRLATSGSVASPGTGIQGFHFPTGGVDCKAGKTYWIDVAANDSATLRFGGWSQTTNAVGARMVAYQRGASGSFPAPAQILPLAHGLAIGTPSSGIALMPMFDPARTAKPPAPTTMGIGSGGEVLAYDPASGRLFAGTSGNALAYSDDQGATWTTTAFSDTHAITAISIVGSNLLIATNTGATPAVGAIYKGPLAGPYTNAAFPATLTAQEGFCRSWNLVAYADGTVFAGNYDPNGNGASLVRIRRSTDSGATWTVVLDLGVSDNALRHVHSIIRDPNNTSNVWANVGDSGAVAGQYKSTDGGATFTRVATFGAMRLTPVVTLADGSFLWLSDQYRMGGNLHRMDAAGTVLQPRSHVDAPWNGDGYALTLSKDAAGVLYYAVRFTNTTYTRTAIFATPDEGVTSYLVADRGNTTGYGTSLIRVGNYLFFENLRYDVSGLAFT